MKNNLNIEDLFRNTLENAEATPPAGAWEAIQAKMGATAATTTAVTATGLSLGKVAAIVFTALGVGLGIGYIAFKGSNEPKNDTNAQVENPIVQDNTVSENTPIQLSEDVKITDISSVSKADKEVSVFEVKKGGEIKKILVEIPHTPDKNNSIANQWLSSKNDKLDRKAILQRIVEELEREDNGETAENTQPVKDKNIVVQKMENDEVIAGIKTTGENLTYDFSNVMGANSYEWNFGDKENNTSNEASPSHTFTEPGNYVVTLKVTNKAGKVFKDQIFLEVKPKEEETAQETSSINQPNVFTPNGDGRSDEFYFTGKNIESFSLTIYDQNNRVVFSTTDISQRWNGNDRSGNPLPNGKYLCSFKAVGKDKKSYGDNYYIMLSGR